MSATTFANRFIRVGSFDTKFIEAGDPEAPTIVFIHEGGFGADSYNTWGTVMASMASKYHVLAPDLLGWGGTDKVAFFDQSPYAPRIRHIAEWCDALGLTDVRFVGNSFGGGLVLRMAAGERPAWPMRCAVSISGTGGPYRIPEGREALADFTPSLAEARRLDSWVVCDVEANEEHARARYEGSMVPGQWEAMSALKLRNPSLPKDAAPRHDPFPNNLSQSPIPILLVEGRYDRMLESGWSQQLAHYIPNVERLEVDGGHSPNIDKPMLVVEFLRDYFTEQ